jgi:hypothetical protein
LAALFGVDDLRRAKTIKRFLQRINRVTGFQGYRDHDGQHFPAGPINNGNKEHKPFCHGDRGRVQRPNLMGPINAQAPQ